MQEEIDVDAELEKMRLTIEEVKSVCKAKGFSLSLAWEKCLDSAYDMIVKTAKSLA